VTLISKLSKLKNMVLAEDEYLDGSFEGLDYPSEEDLDEINKKSENLIKPNALANRNPFEFMNKKSSNVVGMPGLSNSMSTVNIFEPRSFDDMEHAIRYLRERSTVILNLSMISSEKEMQRCIDYLCGATEAMDGHPEQIGPAIFLFAPSCVNVNNVFHDDALPKKTSMESSFESPKEINDTPKPAWGEFKLSAYS
tara:strand:- start:72 stop:659 length:588 start_codon:yes stop_codon:yes gene_type:complete